MIGRHCSLFSSIYCRTSFNVRWKKYAMQLDGNWGVKSDQLFYSVHLSWVGASFLCIAPALFLLLYLCCVCELVEETLYLCSSSTWRWRKLGDLGPGKTRPVTAEEEEEENRSMQRARKAPFSPFFFFFFHESGGGWGLLTFSDSLAPGSWLPVVLLAYLYLVIIPRFWPFW